MIGDLQYELVCSRSLYPTVGLSLLNIGGIFGVYIFGVISDRFVSKLISIANWSFNDHYQRQSGQETVVFPVPWH